MGTIINFDGVPMDVYTKDEVRAILSQLRYEVKSLEEFKGEDDVLIKRSSVLNHIQFYIHNLDSHNGDCSNCIDQMICEEPCEAKRKTLSCRNCFYLGGHAGHCEICHDFNMFLEKDE